MNDETAVYEHPAFTRAKALPTHLRPLFPTTPAEAAAWKSMTVCRALYHQVLVVVVTRVECTWCAYIGAVRGNNHREEMADVA